MTDIEIARSLNERGENNTKMSRFNRKTYGSKEKICGFKKRADAIFK